MYIFIYMYNVYGQKGNAQALHELLKHPKVIYDEPYSEFNNSEQKQQTDMFAKAEERNFLHEFAKRGNADILQELLLMSINLEAFDSKGRTPLHIAALNGHEHVVVLLLQ
ncbi:hypothetical protein RFI_33343, partial [Reticulomyxa filosa]